MSPLAQAFTALTLLSIVGLSAFYPDRMDQLYEHWTTSGDLDMGFPLLALYLYFSIRNLNALPSSRPSYLFVFPLLVALAGIYLAQALDLKTIFFASLVMLIASMTGLSLGWAALKATLLPLLIVNMAMPFWYLAIAPLQSLSALMVGKFVEAISITALVEGTYITLPNGTIHIAGGCSGLKYFLSALSLAFIASCWNHSPLKKVALSVIFAASLAIFANWVRIAILVIIGYEEGVNHPLMADHDSLGWVVFAVLLLPWFWFEGRYANSAPPEQLASSAQSRHEDAFRTKRLILTLTSLAVLALPSWHLNQIGAATAEPRPSYEAAPQTGKARYLSVASQDWQPNYPNVARELSARYLLGIDPIDVIIREYPNNGEAELAKTTQDIFGEQWRKVSEQAWQDQDLKLRIAIAKKGSDYRLIYYWYEHAGAMANSILGSKKEMLLASFSGHYYSHLFALSLSCSLSCQNNPPPPTAGVRTFIQDLRNQYTN